MATFLAHFMNITLLMAQWVEIAALENHASDSCFFNLLGAVLQIDSLESAPSRVITHRHALSV